LSWSNPTRKQQRSESSQAGISRHAFQNMIRLAKPSPTPRLNDPLQRPGRMSSFGANSADASERLVARRSANSLKGSKLARPCLIGEGHHDRVVVSAGRGRRCGAIRHRLSEARASAGQSIGADGTEGKAPELHRGKAHTARTPPLSSSSAGSDSGPRRDRHRGRCYKGCHWCSPVRPSWSRPCWR
jgi:hypothetical protein